MLLSEILFNIECECESFTDTQISDIVYDSRKAQRGTLFVALCGAFSDGHDYVFKAYENGTRVFLCQKEVVLPDDATVIFTQDTRAALSVMSGNFFSHPDRELKLIGVTGTKGKTTITHMLRTVLDKCGVKCGVIGTAGAYFGDKYIPTVNTTPESYETLKILRQMVDSGCQAVCMEVSSLGLKHHRVDDLHFDTAVFTNISPDHIGGHEHESFEEYSYWKKQLFKLCDFAVFNQDDVFSSEIEKEISCEFATFALKENADYTADNVEKIRNSEIFGVSFDCLHNGEKTKIKVAMPGYFSVYNALAAYAVCLHLGVDKEKAAEAIVLAKVTGRNELISVPTDFDVFIDYAHNGISMKSIIESVKAYDHNRIITVFGSVGDRAQLRRRELGLVSGKLSDYSIVTTDDPNFEDPLKIASEIASYIEEAGGSYEIVLDREKAVFRALSMAQCGDIILILGKGQETAQKVRGELVPYSDHEAVRKYFKMN